MSFYDIPYTTFALLKRRVAEEKPYRGTTNEYSLGARRYRSRHFKWYGDHAAIFYGSANLCTIHEDESVEIMRDQLWQGENMMLTSTFHNLIFQSNANKGGDIVRGHLKEHKIFNGLRFNLADNSVHKDRPYEIKVYSLDRELTKPIREEVEEHFNTIKAFFLVSEESQIQEAMRDSDNNDAFVSFCKLGENKGVLSRYGRGMKEPRISIFNCIKRHAINNIYAERRPFKCTTLPGGSVIPQGSWGVEIVKLY
jgi:hypothetical protein